MNMVGTTIDIIKGKGRSIKKKAAALLADLLFPAALFTFTTFNVYKAGWALCYNPLARIWWRKTPFSVEQIPRLRWRFSPRLCGCKLAMVEENPLLMWMKTWQWWRKTPSLNAHENTPGFNGISVLIAGKLT
jgi:hypothetical protein